MKKHLPIILSVLILVFGFQVSLWADSKVTSLSANTDPQLTDALYWVDDPSGTPASEKILWGTLLDDTAGNGDTANVWSADKIYDQLALKQDELSEGEFEDGDKTKLDKVAIQSDCSGITAGFCMDTDDGKIYVWDGDSVELASDLIADLPADIIDSADINWAEPILVPFDNYVYFGDSGIYIGADDDSILDIVADGSVDITNLRLASDLDVADYDLTSVDKVEGYDTGVFIDLGQDSQILFSSDGAGTPFATPDLDFTGTSYFDDDMGLPVDTQFYFGDTGVFIESDDDGYFDVDADTGIRLNANTTISGSLNVGTPTINMSTSNGTLTITGAGDGQDEDIAFDLNSTANTVDVGTNTGVTLWDFGAIGITTTGALTSNYSRVVPQSLTYDDDDDLDQTVGINLTSSVILVTGDNDHDDDSIDLQDGPAGYTGIVLTFIGIANLDDDDTFTIDATTDSTCLGCPSLILNDPGEQITLYWTGDDWIYAGEYEVTD